MFILMIDVYDRMCCNLIQFVIRLLLFSLHILITNATTKHTYTMMDN